MIHITRAHTHATAVLGLFVMVSGCDRVDVREEIVPVTLARTYTDSISDYEKGWSCIAGAAFEVLIPPNGVGLCVFAAGSGIVAKDGNASITVGHQFDYREEFVYGDCSCYVDFWSKTVQRGHIFFDLTKVAPKKLLSAVIEFDTALSYKSSATVVETSDLSGLIAWVNQPQTGNWIADPAKGLLPGFPEIGAPVINPFPAKPEDVLPTKNGQVGLRKNQRFQINITELAQKWRDDKSYNMGLIFGGPVWTMPPGKNKTKQESVGNFSEIKLRITYNAKHPANQPK